MDFIKNAVNKYTSTSLILRIVIGLIVGAILGTVFKGLTWVGLLGTLLWALFGRSPPFSYLC